MPSMYAAGPAVFVRQLNNLSVILDKAEAYATAKKIDPLTFGQTRLIADMLPFTRQIQIACDASKFAVARLSGVEAPKFEDKETTIAELKARVAATVAFIQSVDASKIDGTEDKDVLVKMQGQDVPMKGQPYLLGFALPNFWFHVTMAYALLRQNGVELGKGDFLGGR